MTTKMCAGVLGVVLALGAILPANANGVAYHDSNLERWAKQRIAAKSAICAAVSMAVKHPYL
ncbi:MAG: hypothetical protein HC779_06265 [Phyllobacteriaceae bacterium]|nr:hypothetical protein [Phyllobacteriaceae bacterium]